MFRIIDLKGTPPIMQIFRRSFVKFVFHLNMIPIVWVVKNFLKSNTAFMLFKKLHSIKIN